MATNRDQAGFHGTPDDTIYFVTPGGDVYHVQGPDDAGIPILYRERLPEDASPVDLDGGLAGEYLAALRDATVQVVAVPDEAIAELGRLTTRDEAGRHFTGWATHYETLEDAGLVAIDRPVHGPTGIPYDLEHWSIEVTDAGRELVEAHPELHDADD